MKRMMHKAAAYRLRQALLNALIGDWAMARVNLAHYRTILRACKVTLHRAR